MRKSIVLGHVLAASALFSLTACSWQADLFDHKQAGAQALSATAANDSALSQTGFTQPVPDDYASPSSSPGDVVRVDYDSRVYAGNGAPVTKTAYVYTPYGYDEADDETRYDIVYLMHGWGGHAGDYFEYVALKNTLDHMIANGDIPPVIFVLATFYNPNSTTGFDSSVAELRAFHQDFEENLMQAVEGRFHTYAASTSNEDLRASRMHRLLGGFSLGSVTTWTMLCADYDYIAGFIPMSGSSWHFGGFGDFQTQRNVDYIAQLVADNDLNERGYFVYQAVGTQDSVRQQTLQQAEEMLARPDVFTPQHYAFYQKEGGVHRELHGPHGGDGRRAAHVLGRGHS